MNDNLSLSAPPRRPRGFVLPGLLVLGLAAALFAVRRQLMMSAPMCEAGQWHRCLGTFNGVALLAVVALPLSALVVGALGWRRRAAGVASPWRKSLAEVGMVHGTVPFLLLTMMPGGQAGAEAPIRVSLVPFRDLVAMGPAEIAGNLLVFAALGFFGPMRFAALASVPRVLALGAGCSILVETAQSVLRLDRVSSVDDVLVNAVGAGLAALVSRRWWRTPPPTPDPTPSTHHAA
jgi:hypothetical protein